MASPERWDVAVVGASPAGLAAAHASACRGVDTVLLEAGRIGEPEPPAVVGFERLWPEDWRPPADVVRDRFPGVELTLPGDNRVHVEAAGRIVDRTSFDSWAAERAERAGADVRTETGSWEVREPGRLEGPAGELRARIIVFADGARSIASAIVDPVEAPQRLVWGVTHALPVAEDSERLPIRVGAEAPGGRTQIVSIDEDTTWHWTFARRPRREAIRRARAALRRTARRRGWPASALEEARRLHVAPDPVLQRPARLAGPRTLVAGGAGGLGGLEVGLASGRRAGTTAARALQCEASVQDVLDAYERELRDRYRSAYRGLDRLFSLAERLPDPALATLARTQHGRRFDVDELGGLLAGPRRGLQTVAGLTLRGLVDQARARFGGLN